MELVRSFIAVNLSPEVRGALHAIEDKLRERHHSFVKWVEPENIHITLKFLGNVPQEDLPGIAAAISRIVEPLTEFSLKLEELGAFPNWQRPQVVWVGLGGKVDRLSVIQRDIEEVLCTLGFPRETRRFSPHLTLGRIRDQASGEDRRRFAAWAQSVRFETGLAIDVRQISLMRSRLTPAGAVYSELACVSLKAKFEPSPQ